MATRDNYILAASDSDMVVGDYLLWSEFHQMQMSIDISSGVFRRGKDFWGHEQNFAGNGSFSCAANFYDTFKLKAFIRRWREVAADTKADFLPFIWAASEMAVGKDVGFTLLNPKNETFNLGSGAVVSGDLTGSWNRVLGEGTLVCSSADAGDNIISTDDDSDFEALWQIGGSGADYYSPVKAVSNPSGAAVGLLAHVKEHVGNDAEVPTLTFRFDSATADWRSGVFGAADGGQTMRVGHTVDGQVVYKTFGPYGSSQTTATLYEDIERARWADGFRLFYSMLGADHQGNDTGITFTGSQDGADSDIIFPNDNVMPSGAPWRASDSGTDGDLQIRLVKVLGSGGGRTYIPITDFHPADKSDTPLFLAAVDLSGLSQVALHARLPARGPGEDGYDFQIRYLIGSVVNGS